MPTSYYRDPQVQRDLSAQWRQQYLQHTVQGVVSMPREATAKVQRATSKQLEFVHLNLSGKARCGVKKQVPMVMPAEFNATKHQLCGACAESARTAGVSVGGQRATVVKAKTFKEQQAEELAAAKARAGRTAPVRAVAAVPANQAGAVRKGVPQERSTAPATKQTLRVVQPQTEAKRTITSAMQELIRQGYSNKEVFEMCKDEFNLPPEHKTYPAWYRSRMRQAGEKV